MSTCIIGGGLADIALAVNLKLAGVEDEVLLVTDGNPSNTWMAGQRYRSRVVRQSGDPVERLVELFAAATLDLLDLGGALCPCIALVADQLFSRAVADCELISLFHTR